MRLNYFNHGKTADETGTPEAINNFPRKQSLNVVLEYPCLITRVLKGGRRTCINDLD